MTSYVMFRTESPTAIGCSTPRSESGQGPNIEGRETSRNTTTGHVLNLDSTLVGSIGSETWNTERGVVHSRPSTAFTISLDDMSGRKPSPSKKPPPYLTQRRKSNEKPKQTCLLDYSAEENRLMADIVREDRLNRKREKGKNVDVKLYDAYRRRQFYNYRNEQMRKQEAERPAVDISERRRLVKQMADDTRKRAAGDKLFTSGRQSRVGQSPHVENSLESDQTPGNPASDLAPNCLRSD